MDEHAMSPELFAELHWLSAASLSGEITPEQSRRLEALLSDPAAQELYLELIFETNTLLTWADFPRSRAGDAGKISESAPIASQLGPAAPIKSPVLGFLGGIVSYVSHSRTLMYSLIFGALGLYFTIQFGSLIVSRFWAQNAAQVADDRGAGTEKHSQPVDQPGRGRASGAKIVATLTNAVDCQWKPVETERPSPPFDKLMAGQPSSIRGEKAVGLEVGTEFSAGQKLNLTAGLAELTFDSGAKVILHAPAQFDVTDALGGDLQRGRLTAKVPHTAAGFSVATPGGRVVDLGTEFGVKVRDDGVLNVIVYVGDVNVETGSGSGSGSGGTDEPRVLHIKAGQAFTIGPNHIAKPIPPENERFVRELAPLGDKTKAEAAYVEFMKSLKPAVWFRMEGKDTERVLHDEMGGQIAKLSWDGPGNPFVKGAVGKGLWLRGDKLKDAAILRDYPKAEHGKLSVAAWAYADSNPSGNLALVCNWGVSEGFGQFYFGLNSRNGGKSSALAIYLAPANGRTISQFENDAHPFPLYQWQHVAFTTDGATVRLYREGREVAALKHAGLLYPVPLKALAIGVRASDQGLASSKWPDYWDGKVDELAVFNDTLSADDIRKLASFGR